ncbi:hypothetical protein F4779DRAFT_170588 [Xylariaceae sp. FL0662B]|nr:hypothetical protein F4779DRAFT_170588 [Xylariaceae sp. FL0662B]
MQFKLSTVLAVVPLWLAATTYGSPVDNAAAGALEKRVQLPSLDLEKAQWTDLGDNWQFTKVQGSDGPGGDGQQITKRWTKPMDWLNAHMKDSSAGLVDKYDSRKLCLDAGTQFTGTIIRKNIGDACNALINRVPGATLADDGWTFLNRMGMTDISGGPAYLQFVFATLNKDVKPTVQLCQSAIDGLLGSECMKKDKSKGGLMAIGKSFLVGFNPQVNGEPNL